MRSLKLLVGFVLVISCALIAAGCGGPSAKQQADARLEQLALLKPELEDRLRDRASALKQSCENQIGDFLDALSSLDSRLDIGLNYSEYGDAVADVNVAYDRLEPGDLQGDCLSAAAKGETALNAYIKAFNVWKDCVDDDYCNNDSITSNLQAKWSNATSQVDQAQKLISGLDTTDTVGLTDFPRFSDAVSGTVYGTIVSVICDPPDPPAATKPCEQLRNLLAGGVTDKEIGDVDGSVEDLVKALGLTPT